MNDFHVIVDGHTKLPQQVAKSDLDLVHGQVLPDAVSAI